MIRDITARRLVATVRPPDRWFRLDYNLNLYRGCQHQCIYCDSRSACYGIEDIEHEVLVKRNAIDLLDRELASKRNKGVIGLGSMNDPYMPLEAGEGLTRRALEVIARRGFGVHIITKSDLVLRDRDLLSRISRERAAVSFTITTADDELGRQVEPAAPAVSRRFAALAELSGEGLLAGVTLMPVLPFIEDNWENIRALVERAHACGARYIIASFGMTMRDRQREHYYRELDRRFPGLRARYESTFGESYSCPARGAGELEGRFRGLCRDLGLAMQIPFPARPEPAQLPLFEKRSPQAL